MSDRFIWLTEEQLPEKTRVIQMEKGVIDCFEDPNDSMHLISTYGFKYLIDLNELSIKDRNVLKGRLRNEK